MNCWLMWRRRSVVYIYISNFKFMKAQHMLRTGWGGGVTNLTWVTGGFSWLISWTKCQAWNRYSFVFDTSFEDIATCQKEPTRKPIQGDYRVLCNSANHVLFHSIHYLVKPKSYSHIFALANAIIIIFVGNKFCRRRNVS